jgi:lanosterol synthase
MPVLSTYLPLRKVANDAAYAQVTYEDENTGYQTIGPVGKSYSMMCRFAREGPDSHAFKAHLSRVDDFLWLGKHGMMMTGTNGTQLWDVGFLGQAMVETGLAGEEENTECALGMLDWLDKAQMREDPKWYVEGYRHRTKGAWSFSTPEQSYTVRCLHPEAMIRLLIYFRCLTAHPKD